MSAPLPAPAYDLEEQVRDTPYLPRPEWSTASHPEPWHVVGRLVTQLLGATPVFTYIIQPATLTGHWRGHDHPVVVDENQLARWDATPTTPDTREEFVQLGLPLPPMT